MQLGAYLSLAAATQINAGWVTLHGTHVFIGDDGTITKGPSAFVGKKPSDLNKGSDKDAHAARVQRAMKSQVRTAYQSQLIAEKSEAVLSRAVGIPRTR